MKRFPVFMILLLLYACNSEINPVIDSNDNNTTPTDTLASDTTSSGIDYIYNVNDFPELTIMVSTEEWNKLLNYYNQNSHNEEYVVCNFTYIKNGNVLRYDSAGFKLRGNTSRRRPEGNSKETHNSASPDWHHASFAVKFNKFIKGRKLSGLEKINLKWFKDDSMYAREVYCYDLFRKFGVWTAPRSGYCKLYIKIEEDEKPAYFGVYELLEPIGDDFLKSRKNHFKDSNGFLWKASWGADLKSADLNNMGLENITLTSTYIPVYDLKNNPKDLTLAKAQLAEFITNLNNKTGEDFKTWISSKTDIELFLKTYAVNVMCGMWDDYWVNKNNYYFYFNSDGKFFFIPYDYDNTLGTSLLVADAGRQDLMNWGKSSYPLVKKIISISEYGELYKSYLHELADSNNDYFYIDNSINRIQNWQNRIKDYIENDTGEDMSLIDQPASWGNCGFYRLIDTNNNFFKIRAANLPQ
ncbi:MAG: CotH kinase family protein [Paludibacter sp.]|nr:CotH kinase family protein [Paludibacter sp.]